MKIIKPKFKVGDVVLITSGELQGKTLPVREVNVCSCCPVSYSIQGSDGMIVFYENDLLPGPDGLDRILKKL